MKKKIALSTVVTTALAGLFDSSGMREADFTAKGKELFATIGKKSLLKLSKTDFELLDKQQIAITATPGKESWAIAFKDANGKTIISKDIDAKWFSKKITKPISIIASLEDIDGKANISLSFTKKGSSFNAILLSTKMQKALKQSSTMQLRKGILTLGKDIEVEMHTIIGELLKCSKNTCKKYAKIVKRLSAA